MLDPHLLLIFLAGALALNFTPGPDMAFTLASAASGGRRAGFAAALGIGAGSLIWGGFAAAGLAALLATSAHALTVIRLAGAAYLIWLAVRTVMTLDALPEASGAASVGTAFRRGMLTNLLNPKVGIFYLAFLPGFTNAELGPVWLQTLLLAGIFSVTGTIVLCGVAVLAGAARATLARSRTWRRALNGLAALAFGALGLRLLLSRNLI